MDLKTLKQKKSVKDLLEFGIININKPSGPTSFNISDFVRKTLNLRKTSHFGTLDPKVTGVLPIALNRACKLTGYFLGEDKEYIGIMRIHKDVTKKEIEKKIKEKFTGKIKQLPPLKSRVKRELREREIKEFKILEINDKDILFKTNVQGGTYIRKLIDDLGRELGIGAHMLELRRIRAGIFTEDDKTYPSANLYDFEKVCEEYKNGNEELLRKIIIPGEIISELFPAIKIKKENLKQIFTGKPIHEKDLVKKEKIKKGETIIVFCEDKFVGIYEIKYEEHVYAKAKFVLQEVKE
ncbi:MAG: RNA-guided pseudouridylation complex pseudouridine synthase subunit Cbf5 [Candidatus Pacearchaeota archaeon]|jgi:H/ACA ribonucleoprotein complex subunit 4